MKSILIIGMGRFGQHLCKNLAELGNQIMIVDEDEESVESMMQYAVSAKVGDCTNETVLKSLGIGNFDVIFICIATNFQSSLETTSLVKEMGAKHVVSKADRDIHAKFLLRNGADEVVYPDRDIAEKIAVRYSSNSVFDYIELTDKYSIYEIPPLPEWAGKTLKDLNLTNTHNISVLGSKHEGQASLMPRSDYVVNPDDHLMIIGQKEDMNALLKKLP